MERAAATWISAQWFTFWRILNRHGYKFLANGNLSQTLEVTETWFFLFEEEYLKELI